MAQLYYWFCTLQNKMLFSIESGIWLCVIQFSYSSYYSENNLRAINPDHSLIITLRFGCWKWRFFFLLQKSFLGKKNKQQNHNPTTCFPGWVIIQRGTAAIPTIRTAAMHWIGLRLVVSKCPRNFSQWPSLRDHQNLSPCLLSTNESAPHEYMLWLPKGSIHLRTLTQFKIK